MESFVCLLILIAIKGVYFSLQAGEVAAEIKRKIEKKEKKKKKREKRKLEALLTAEGDDEAVESKKAKSNGDAESQVSERFLLCTPTA